MSNCVVSPAFAIVSYTTVDLLSFFKEGSAAMDQAVDQELSLQDPINHSQTVGKVWVRVEAATINRLEETLWERLLKLVDINGDGIADFCRLIGAAVAGQARVACSIVDPSLFPC